MCTRLLNHRPRGSFAVRGHKQCLRPVKRSPAGKHRAQWFLSASEPQTSEARSDSPSAEITDGSMPPWSVISEKPPPSLVQPTWQTRPLIGNRSLAVKSPQGLLWAAQLDLVDGKDEGRMLWLVSYTAAASQRPLSEIPT